jgi:hypothetical protein
MTEADLLAGACTSHLSPLDHEFATDRLKSMRYRTGMTSGRLEVAPRMEATPWSSAPAPSNPINCPEYPAALNQTSRGETTARLLSYHLRT